MTASFADRLLQAVRDKAAPAAVALDPVLDRLPAGISGESAPDRVLAFGRRVIEAVALIVPVVKINIAYFEVLGPTGVRVYHDLIADASRKGLIVIGDVKRGDVGHTAELYAQAHLGGGGDLGSKAGLPDAITVSGYFGRDGVAPFIEIARPEGRGIFVLVRTSNPSAAEIQDVEARDGKKLHEHVAACVARWAADSDTIGRCGYSAVGAVVATRDAADAARLRDAMPRSIFLVPGYGAQGGRAEDFRPYFKPDGTGAIVAAGRSIIFAHERPEYRDRFDDDWQACIAHACKEFVADLRRVIPQP